MKKLKKSKKGNSSEMKRSKKKIALKNDKTLYRSLSLDEKDYFIKRLDEQIEWYDESSIEQKRKYKHKKVIIIISSSVIPILLSFDTEQIGIKVFMGVLSILITVLEGWISMGKYHENWIQYRSICETLKHEKFMYLYKSGVYSEENNTLPYLVERIENVISQENINWASMSNRGTSGEKAEN